MEQETSTFLDSGEESKVNTLHSPENEDLSPAQESIQEKINPIEKQQESDVKMSENSDEKQEEIETNDNVVENSNQQPMQEVQRFVNFIYFSIFILFFYFQTQSLFSNNSIGCNSTTKKEEK